MTICQPVGNVFALLSIAIVVAVVWDEVRIELQQRSFCRRQRQRQDYEHYEDREIS